MRHLVLTFCAQNKRFVVVTFIKTTVKYEIFQCWIWISLYCCWSFEQQDGVALWDTSEKRRTIENFKSKIEFEKTIVREHFFGFICKEKEVGVNAPLICYQKWHFSIKFNNFLFYLFFRPKTGNQPRAQSAYMTVSTIDLYLNSFCSDNNHFKT